MTLTKENITKDTSTNSLKVLRIILILFTILWMYIIFDLSNDTSIDSSTLSTKVLEFINSTIETFTEKNIMLSISADSWQYLELILRKLAHMFIYFVLSITVMSLLFTFKIKIIKSIFITITFNFIYACSDEFHQAFVPGRGPSITDVFIDTCGTILGILFALIIYCIIHTIYYKIQKSKIEKYNKKISSEFS